jgi:hypothetical protein
MAKAKKRRRSGKRKGQSAWNRKFGAASKACFREGPTSGHDFGRCMKRKLK